MAEGTTNGANARSPVDFIPSDADRGPPIDSTGLCLSGGGYRAMLFHVGTLWRLHEVGLLATVERVSSVSGGSITAAVLALAWHDLQAGIRDFRTAVVEPVRRLGSTTINRKAILSGVFWFGTASQKVQKAYAKVLFGSRTLQDLPETPRFVFNATNVQSGALWRFSRPYMRDWRVGKVGSPTVSIAQAVAASSAFPPVLSPCILELSPGQFESGTGEDLQKEPYTRRVALSDGGVYDNLGLETVWKSHRTVLVSDAGGQIAPEPEPHSDWARHAKRVLDLIDNQVRSLRKRQLLDSYRAPSGDQNHRDGAYWSIRSATASFPVQDSLVCPPNWVAELAATPTRLKALPDQRQEALINWGYAICDIALRSWVDDSLAAPSGFPYPASAPG